MHNQHAVGLALVALSLSLLFIQFSTEAQLIPEHRGGLHRGRLFEGLALSDGQRSEIDNLITSNRDNLRPLRAVYSHRQLYGLRVDF